MENGTDEADNNADIELEWVEIVEPQTKQHMYANLRTGQCAWEPPARVPVKRTHSNQWWELFDSNTQRFYYYNATSTKTVWQRPSNCDIIPLAKLQSLKENTESSSVQKNQHESASSVVTVTTTKKNSETQTSPKEERRAVAHDSSSTVYAQNISPAFGLVSSRQESVSKPSVTDVKQQSEDLSAQGPSHTSATSPGGSSQDSLTRLFEKDHGENPPPAVQRYPIVGRESCIACRSSLTAAVKPQPFDQKSVFSPETFAALYDSSSPKDSSLPLNTANFPNTSSETPSSATSLPVSNPRFPVVDNFDDTVANKEVSREKARAKAKIALDLEWVLRDLPNLECNPLSPGLVDKRSQTSPGVRTSRSNSLSKGTVESGGIGVPGFGSSDTAKSKNYFLAKSSKASNGEQVAESWTKDALKQPLTGDNDDKAFRKEALSFFKVIQCYMGDRKSKLSPNQLALTLCEAGFSREAMADELYCQMMKQLNGNEKYDSVRRGWELLAILLSFFSPSSEEISQKLTSFVDSNSDHLLDAPEVPVSQYATQCLRRMRSVQARQEPSLQRIQESRVHIFSPPQFCASLEDLMTMQAEKYPGRKLPWIETTLIDLILTSDGERTEGLFRVPANPDHINAARLRLDRGLVPVVRDAHVPAALLKLWLRSLPEPIIPDALYTRCLEVSDKPAEACRIIELLPLLNRMVLVKLLDLLQMLANEEIVKHTKMDACNLAMVMAPNILRCCSNDPRVMFDNTRREMSFIKTLIAHYDASYVRDLL